MARSRKPDVAREGFAFDGAREQWEKTNDPRWVWRAIGDRIHHREPMPDWVLDYLKECAAGIEEAKGDIARELHGILGFSNKSGRKRDSTIDLKVEQFAMAFAAPILRGEPPGKARDVASVKVDGPRGKDNKELKQRLKDFFDLERLPTEQQHWKLVVAQWLLLHPWYTERYPDLPTKFDFRPKG